MLPYRTLAVCLLLGGCAAAPVYHSTTVFKCEPLSLDSVALPPPLKLEPLPADIKIQNGEVILSPGDMQVLVQALHEQDRFYRDMQATWKQLHTIVDAHNKECHPPEVKQSVEPKPEVKWYNPLTW